MVKTLITLSLVVEHEGNDPEAERDAIEREIENMLDYGHIQRAVVETIDAVACTSVRATGTVGAADEED